jgi:hypothetical protein
MIASYNDVSSGLPNCCDEPIEETRRSPLNRHSQDLREFIAVLLTNGLLQCFEAIFCCLDEQQRFLISPQFSFPPIR